MEFDRSHTVHWLCGYNQAGNRFYCDKNLPRYFVYDGRDIPVDQFLMVHETTEKKFLDMGLPYDAAHRLALIVERKAVEAQGVSWKAYDAFMQKWIRKNEHEKLDDLPPDLEDPMTRKVFRK